MPGTLKQKRLKTGPKPLSEKAAADTTSSIIIRIPISSIKLTATSRDICHICREMDKLCEGVSSTNIRNRNMDSHGMVHRCQADTAERQDRRQFEHILGKCPRCGKLSISRPSA